MILVDNLRAWPTYPSGHKYWAHMWHSDNDLDALDAFAERLGLKRHWRHKHEGLIHYDLTPTKRIEALALGAVKMQVKDWLRGSACNP